MMAVVHKAQHIVVAAKHAHIQPSYLWSIVLRVLAFAGLSEFVFGTEVVFNPASRGVVAIHLASDIDRHGCRRSSSSSRGCAGHLGPYSRARVLEPLVVLVSAQGALLGIVGNPVKAPLGLAVGRGTERSRSKVLADELTSLMHPVFGWCWRLAVAEVVLFGGAPA
jgi:hypothetical protein